MKHIKHFCSALLVALAIIVTVSADAQPAIAWDVYTPSDARSVAIALSADAKRIVGAYSRRVRHGPEQWVWALWDASLGTVTLSQLGTASLSDLDPWSAKHLIDISADGRVISMTDAKAAACLIDGRYTSIHDNLPSLAGLPKSSSMATAVSADGNVIVGLVQYEGNYWGPGGYIRNPIMMYMWVRSANHLYMLFGPDSTLPYLELLDVAKTGEGNYLGVGAASYSGRPMLRATLVEYQHGSWPIGADFAGYSSSARVLAPTADWVFGHAYAATETTAYDPYIWRWREGMTAPERLASGSDFFHTEPFASTAEGKVVILGLSRGAFIWSDGKGVQDLNAMYRNLLTDGSRIECATDITPDGRYLVGFGYHAPSNKRRAFLLARW